MRFYVNPKVVCSSLTSSFVVLFFLPVKLKRGRSPGRRRRYQEAACNIEEREEEAEKRVKGREG